MVCQAFCTSCEDPLPTPDGAMILRSSAMEQDDRIITCEKKLAVSGRRCQIVKSSAGVTNYTAPRNAPIGGGQR